MKPAGTIFRRAIFLVAALALSGCLQDGESTSDLQTAKSPLKALVTAKQDAAAQSAVVYPTPGPIGEFLERAFRYRKPLEVSDGGRFMRVPYDEFKDINARDEIPVRKVKSWWVSPLPKNSQVEREYSVGGRTHAYWAIGKLDGGSAMTVIYVHGRGGSRDWGFDDERFGGNFNRLKNLMVRLGGAYLSPDFTDFENDGLADIKSLVAKYRPLTTGPLVVSCGSLGNAICWNLAQDATAVRQLDGLIILSGFPDERFFSSPAAHGRHVPLVISHGTWDPDYDYKPTVEFYQKLRKAIPDYPVRYILFETGKHGAPVRMIDWRDTLNWISSH